MPPDSPRASYNFNPGWKFFKGDVTNAEQVVFDDSKWETVSTPHTYNDVDTYDEIISHSGGEKTQYMGVTWYRKHFRLPMAAKGGKAFIEFEGLKQAGRFWVNGKPAGKYENGVTPCGLDITDLVNFGDEENVLAVKVDNSNDYKEEATGAGFEWMGRAFNPNYGGLNHDVWLHLVGKVYQTFPLYENLKTTGVYVYPANISIKGRTCDVMVESQVRNESGDQQSVAFSAMVVDADDVVRAKLEGDTSDLVSGQTEVLKATGKLANARFWDINDPYLYDVYSILTVNGKVVDVCKTHTGFRKTEFKGGAGKGGIWLNDRFVYLTGYAQRSSDDWAGLGQAYPDWMHDFNAELLRSSHANYIRWMHIAPQRVDVSACDKHGIIQVVPAGDKEKDVEGRQWEQRMEVMRDTIIYYRNNPSILFWEAGNTVVTPAHMQQMVEVRHQWDPNGGRVMGTRGDSNNAANNALTPIAEYYGVMIGQDPRTDQLTGPTNMFRAYSAERRDKAPLLEAEDFRDEAARRFWDDYSPPHFGFKPGPNDTYHWNSETFCLEAAKRYHDYFINRISNPDPAYSKWSGYASIYWSDSNADGRQDSSEVCRVSGKVDSVRLPKEAYFVYRVMQNDQPDIHIIGHWTYPPNTRKTVYVAANHCESVELFVNGKSRGTVKTPTNGYMYVFADIVFEPGTIKAIGVTAGKVVCQREIKTAGQPKRLKLAAHTSPTGLQADGSDVALIDVEVVDAQGERCPTDEARVDFDVQGPVIWRGGYNSGKPGSTNNKYLDTECGINRVAVRSTLQPGTITITATRPGLESATIHITSQSVAITDALTQRTPKPAAAPSSGKVVPMNAQPFDLQQVRLLDGPFKDAMERDRRYLLELDPDRLLHNFRVTAGLPSVAKPLGGWEQPDCELRGHSVGHYLSACALMYASTGDERLKARTEYLVTELARCQQALPTQGYNPGFLSAYPEFFFDCVDRCERVWAPYYTLHKIMAGLLDVHVHCGNREALEVVKNMADWLKFRVDRLTHEQMQRSLGNEHGGMNEVLANLYAITGNPEHLRLAYAFNHEAVFNPLARGEDKLDGLHANTQVPKIIGAAREYELTGDARLKDIATFFWQRVALHRSYVIGGDSDHEHFFPVDQFAGHLSTDTAETCNTYNMLKLTRHLFAWQPSAETMDFYERALYNHILASQDPEQGMFVYLMSLKPGHFKTYSTPEDSFWCCVGTGMENHSKYGDTIYFRDADSLYVNLFIASELTWKEKGLVVRQRTRFPEQDTTRLTMQCEQPIPLALKIRYPAWAHGLTVKVNGQNVGIITAPGSYVTVSRAWRDGDQVEIRLPMTLHLEPLPGNPDTVAVLYGPIVLAGALGSDNMPNPYARAQTDLNRVPSPAAPLFVGDKRELVNHMALVPGKALTFRTKNIGQPRDVTLIPFYQMHHQRYTVYWQVRSPLDLSQYKLDLVYESDFSRPQKIAREEDFIERSPSGEWRRTGRPPADAEWIAEGWGGCMIRDGKLWVTPSEFDVAGQPKPVEPARRSHMVVWNRRVFPADFLLEFDANHCGSTNGLMIVFFCATGKNGEDMFDLALPPRRGEYKAYHSGVLANYSDAYWSRNNEMEAASNRLRKNPGFIPLAFGESQTTGRTDVTDRVRILKVKGHIEVEVNRKVVLIWDDTVNPLDAGRIGLRSMEGITSVAYDKFKVWEIGRQQ